MRFESCRNASKYVCGPDFTQSSPDTLAGFEMRRGKRDKKCREREQRKKREEGKRGKQSKGQIHPVNILATISYGLESK